MRILHLVHDFLPRHVAGVEVYTDLLTQRLARDHDVGILFTEVVDNAPDGALRPGRRGDVRTWELVNNQRLRHFEQTWRNPGIDARAAEVLDAFRPEVVHVQHLLNLSVGILDECARRAIPVVMTLHDHWLECANGGQRYHRELGRCRELDARRCAECTAHMSGPGLGARGWLQRRRAAASRGGSLSLLDLAPRVETAAADYVYRDRYAVDGQLLPAWVAHPPTQLLFGVEAVAGATFSAWVALHPSTFELPGGCVIFSVHCNGELRAEVELDPRRREPDRQPLHVEVPLDAGHDELELRTRTADGDNRHCTAAWIDPRVRGAVRTTSALGQAIARPMLRAARAATRIPVAMQQRRIERRWDAMRALAGRVELFLAPSRYLRDEVVRFGLPADRVLHCDYGFAVERFAARDDLPDAARRFGFVGSLVPHKGVHVLVEAFGSMPGDAVLEVAGSLDYDPGYARRLQRQARHPGIRFVGPVAPERVPAHLRSLDCQVVPSIWCENSPLTIHEAFLSGIPVVASRLGGSIELLEGGGGLLYEALDANDLRRTLRRLYDEPGLARHLAASAPAVKSLDEQADELLPLYERARDGARAARQRVG